MSVCLSKRVAVSSVICVVALFVALLGVPCVQAATPAFDINKVSDMSGFDPGTFENPTGDVIKIGVVDAFSGPGAFNGQIYWMVNTWLAYDLDRCKK